MFNLNNLIKSLRQNEVILYPTESIFGIGCNPDSTEAIQKLLKLKKRPWQKGLILIASDYNQVKKYVNDKILDHQVREKIFSTWPGHITWVLPCNSSTHKLLTGTHNSIAVRITSFEPIRRICLAFGKPIISTSANLSGHPPSKDIKEIYDQLHSKLPTLNEFTGEKSSPSEIRDAFSNQLIRS